MRKRTLLVTCAVYWLLFQPAVAEQISHFEIGNWSGGGYTHTETGEFSHCAASADYENGITLVFSIDRHLSWAMGLFSEQWKMTEGDSYPVRYRIDRSGTHDGIATVVSPSQVKIPLPGDDRLFNRMRQGQLLTVEAAGQTMKFDLNKTGQMLATLFDCAKYWDRSYVKPSENPFSGKKND